MHCHQLTLFADYYQFYLQDKTASGDLSQAWSPEAVERMLTVADGVVGFGTLRNMQVGVTLEMLEEPPASDTAGFDHVVEGSLDARSGTLVVAGCTDYFPDAARFALAPGTYRVRLSISGADTLSEDGLEGEDHYLVQLWQAPLAEPAVLKQG
ncbi:hypothetical protein [Pseudomonas sp. PA27(2017)]|uniref:hypothetical protein n=1 Tax=Pseudomonas sp. PA27(2017) TaxID=1932112 RepID=UPI000963629E|nr:hypothetical protein [Pseudomonas sp. PA27(2017)]OLU24198.1 hypothetical protein BVH06_23890 [Pseudomonas sp. PA27(2017)]